VRALILKTVKIRGFPSILLICQKGFVVPIYAYKCSSCGHAEDTLQKLSAAPLTICPACQQETYVKQVTAAGFQLKGSGWYVTDFRNNGGSAGATGSATAKTAVSGGSSDGAASSTATDSSASKDSSSSDSASKSEKSGASSAAPASPSSGTGSSNSSSSNTNSSAS
jgi:putative FmdB family regulatory protein